MRKRPRARPGASVTAVAGLAAAAAGAFALAKLLARRGSQAPGSAQRIVVLGAGFAGLTVARELHRRLGRRAQILLVDRHNYHLFTPLLYQVATCGVAPYDVAYPARQFAARQRVAFRRGVVTGIDFAGQRVHLEPGDPVPYDYLVIALGTTTNFFGHQGAGEHALPLKWLEDGVAIRNHVVDVLEQASVTEDGARRRALLTFVVVGGGATGVETAAALADLMQRLLPMDYPNLDAHDARIVVLEGSAKLLGHMSHQMSDVALKQLQRLRVDVWLNARAKDVQPSVVVTEDGRSIDARTIIWTTGVRAPAVVESLQAPHGEGGSLLVDEQLQVPGWPGVFAAGDNAHLVDPFTQRPVPQLAAAAVQEGKTVAENVVRAIEGRPLLPFYYHSMGNVVSLGRSAGAAEVGTVVVDGVFGWLAWRLIHLVKITSFRNRLATALDWSVAFVYQQDSARIEVERAATPAQGHGSPAA